MWYEIDLHFELASQLKNHNLRMLVYNKSGE